MQNTNGSGKLPLRIVLQAYTVKIRRSPPAPGSGISLVEFLLVKIDDTSLRSTPIVVDNKVMAMNTQAGKADRSPWLTSALKVLGGQKSSFVSRRGDGMAGLGLVGRRGRYTVERIVGLLAEFVRRRRARPR